MFAGANYHSVLNSAQGQANVMSEAALIFLKQSLVGFIACSRGIPHFLAFSKFETLYCVRARMDTQMPQYFPPGLGSKELWASSASPLRLIHHLRGQGLVG